MAEAKQIRARWRSARRKLRRAAALPPRCATARIVLACLRSPLLVRTPLLFLSCFHDCQATATGGLATPAPNKAARRQRRRWRRPRPRCTEVCPCPRPLLWSIPCRVRDLFWWHLDRLPPVSLVSPCPPCSLMSAPPPPFLPPPDYDILPSAPAPHSVSVAPAPSQLVAVSQASEHCWCCCWWCCCCCYC